MAVPERKPDPRDGDHRVIDFQPRAKRKAVQPDSILRPVEKDGRPPRPSPPIDYRQRTMANLAAALFAIVLAGVGVWLVTTLNHMQQTQDCVMMGLRDCGTPSAPNS